MSSQSYSYLTTTKVQCPKCGNLGEVVLQNSTRFRLEYAGACDSVLQTGARCGTVLLVGATAHLFPEQLSRATAENRS